MAKLEPCEEHIDQLTQAAQALMRLRCHNRGRERRKLRHFLVDWALLQELADGLDAQLQQVHTAAYDRQLFLRSYGSAPGPQICSSGIPARPTLS